MSKNRFILSEEGWKIIDRILSQLENMSNDCSDYIRDWEDIVSSDRLSIKTLRQLLHSIIELSFNLTKLNLMKPYVNDLRRLYIILGEDIIHDIRRQRELDELIVEVKSNPKYTLPLKEGFGMDNPFFNEILDILDDSYDEDDTDIVVEELINMLGTEYNERSDYENIEYDYADDDDFHLVNKFIEDVKDYKYDVPIRHEHSDHLQYEINWSKLKIYNMRSKIRGVPN